MAYNNQTNGKIESDSKYDKDAMKEVANNHPLPLQYSWTLWHTAPATGGGWSDNFQQIAQFSTVCEFWRLFNNISPPSLLDHGSSYHLFKGKVKPAWEDKFNENGGAWTYRFGAVKAKNVSDARREAANSANYAWYHSVLNMIGNNFTHSEDICGIVINIKKGGRGKIELWIKDASAVDKVKDIGAQFKQFCGATRKKGVEIEFMSFASQLKKGGKKMEKIKL
jgi:translation initiation factor 4E